MTAASDLNERRAAEVAELSKLLTVAVRAAKADPTNEELWREVATYAGNVQRRARLLGGLGRGG